MLENFVETEGTKYAKSKGWLVYKGKVPGRVGFHDRLHFKDGICFTIEYKRPGGKVSPSQRKVAEELTGAGVPCFCVDSLPYAKKVIDEMTLMRQHIMKGVILLGMEKAALSEGAKTFEAF